MRWIASMLLILLFAAQAHAQAKGEVEAIGFGGNYRGDGWTSMVVRLTPDSSSTAAYKIQVIQEDVDRDKVLYERPITLTGNSEGAVREQRFWMYFLPQATLVAGEHGLPQPSEGLDALRQKLKVF